MLEVRRLNMDNSWQVKWDNHIFLIDPWLTGTEIDGFSWFNEQWHVTPPLNYTEVGNFDFVIVSQQFPDHFHPETLKILGNNYPIYAIPGIIKKIKRNLHNTAIYVPLMQKSLIKDSDEVQVFHVPQKKLISTFNGLVILYKNEYLFFAPHGGPFDMKYLDLLKAYSCKALFTTFILYELPFFLGGKINPGIKTATELVQSLNPRYVINTHDEDKHAKGISNKIAKRKYPSQHELTIPGYIALNDYTYKTLE